MNQRLHSLGITFLSDATQLASRAWLGQVGDDRHRRYDVGMRSVTCRYPQPVCQCGCGSVTAWDSSRGRWKRYVDGHYAEHRKISDEERREKARLRSATWRAANPEKVRESSRKYLASGRYVPWGWRQKDPEGYKAYLKDYRAKNVDRIREIERARYQRDRDKRLFGGKKLKYGITREAYDAMLADQNGLCAICGGPPNGRWPTLHIDHCHATGGVRALLCNACNHGLGRFRDSPDMLRKAAMYIEAFR